MGYPEMPTITENFTGDIRRTSNGQVIYRDDELTDFDFSGARFVAMRLVPSGVYLAKKSRSSTRSTDAAARTDTGNMTASQFATTSKFEETS